MDEPETRIAPGDVCDEFCPTGAAQPLKDKVLEVAGLSELFRVLSDETRTKIVYLLSFKELCVCDLAGLLEMSLPAVSHHLRLLRALRLVKHRRKGKSVFYSLEDHHIVNLIRKAQEHFAERR
jgi:ArsR family transcriptional regulator